MLALRSVRRNLLRSFLTVLGIVIGVGAVITMVTLGNGATQAIEKQITSLGTNLLMVMPGQRGPVGAGGGGGRRRRAAVHRSRCRCHPRADRRCGRRRAAGPRQRHRGGQRPQLGHQRHRQQQRLVHHRQLGARRRPAIRRRRATCRRRRVRDWRNRAARNLRRHGGPDRPQPAPAREAVFLRRGWASWRPRARAAWATRTTPCWCRW